MKIALWMHIKLFLDTREVLQNLNKSAQAKQIKTDIKRKIADTRDRLERSESMNCNLYNDYADGLLNERDYLFAKKKYVLEAENLAQKLSELSEMQLTYEEEYAGSHNMEVVMEKYADFEELSSEMVHELISRTVFYGGQQIEIQFAFEDQVQKLVELAKSRKGEITCIQQAM